MKSTPVQCTSQARWRCTNTTLLCGAQTVSRRFVNTSPSGKRPWPCASFENRKSTASFISSHSLSYIPLLPYTTSSCILSRVKCQKTWHLTALTTTLKKRRGEEKKLYHPFGLIEGISDALGVRHSSSSFLHWCLYKQVSKTPDLVWQTFSKVHLKRGWESDTPTPPHLFFFS